MTVIWPNNPPLATIEDISPNPVEYGHTIFFNGSADDVDGFITNFTWRSSLDGLIGTQQNFTINSSLLSEGIHTITLRVQDDNNNWSVPANTFLLVLPRLPEAFIDSISPTPGSAGRNVTLIGHGTDPDGEIIDFLWRSSIDGNLSHQASFSISNLSLGTHTIYFSVQDDLGSWSIEVSVTIYINDLPIAIIDNVNVEHASKGLVEATLKGHGVDNDTIQAHEWRSDIDGLLGGGSPLVLTNLTPGTHTISLRVQDEWGEWSEWVDYSKPIEVTITADGEDPTSLWGIPITTFAWFLLLVLAVVGGGTASWQYNVRVFTKQIKEPLTRLQTLADRHEAAELEYDRVQYQRILNHLTIWKYRSVQAETAVLEKSMNETLDLFVEAKNMITKAQELADKARTKDLEFDLKLLEKTELAFKERRLEDSKWAAVGFIDQLEELSHKTQNNQNDIGVKDSQKD